MHCPDLPHDISSFMRAHATVLSRAATFAYANASHHARMSSVSLSGTSGLFTSMPTGSSDSLASHSCNLADLMPSRWWMIHAFILGTSALGIVSTSVQLRYLKSHFGGYRHTCMYRCVGGQFESSFTS